MLNRIKSVTYELCQSDFDELRAVAGSDTRVMELMRVALRRVFRDLDDVTVRRRNDGIDTNSISGHGDDRLEISTKGSKPVVLLDGVVQRNATEDLRDAMVRAWDAAWNAASERPSWRDVPVTTLEGEAVESEAERADILDRYRVNGCVDAWVVRPKDLEWLGDDAVCAGPRPEQIDWSGIEEVLEAAVDGFVPTHEVTFTADDGTVTVDRVMVDEDPNDDACGHAAYTLREYATGSGADWWVDDKGEWQWRDGVTPGRANGMVSVRKL